MRRLISVGSSSASDVFSLVSSRLLSVFSLVSRYRNHETAPEAAAAALAGVSRHAAAEG